MTIIVLVREIDKQVHRGEKVRCVEEEWWRVYER